MREFQQLQYLTVTDRLQCQARFAFRRAVLVRADVCHPLGVARVT